MVHVSRDTSPIIAPISRNVAHLNILVHDVINVLYYIILVEDLLILGFFCTFKSARLGKELLADKSASKNDV